jgi:hypothetical protein
MEIDKNTYRAMTTRLMVSSSQPIARMDPPSDLSDTCLALSDRDRPAHPGHSRGLIMTIDCLNQVHVSWYRREANAKVRTIHLDTHLDNIFGGMGSTEIVD